jgi:hypothetical protein
VAPPFVPPSPIGNAQKSLSQGRDRWFESVFLRHGVCLTGARHGLQAQWPGFRREREPGRDQRERRAGPEPARLGCFSVTGIDAVPLWEIKALNKKSPGLGLDTTLSRVGSSAPQQAALIGPVERQIQFDQTRRGEFDGLPALQHHLD